MQDVDRIPDPPAPSAPLEPTTTSTLDGWIEGLMSCKQLSEQDVQRLCDKVCLFKEFGDFSINKSVMANMSTRQAREILQEESNVQPVVCWTHSMYCAEFAT